MNQTDRQLRIVGSGLLACLIAGLLFVALGQGAAFAVQQTLTQDTIPDFNPGLFYHTGLTASTDAGGDANGQVRLLNVGINPATWNKGTGNTTGLPSSGLWGHGAVAANTGGTDRIYVTGGYNGSAGTGGVYYSPISSSTHNLGAWTASAALPVTVYKHATVALGGYLYVIGGLSPSGGMTTASKAVYKSQLNASGVPGSWSLTGALPVTPTVGGLYDVQAVVAKGRIYVLGGRDVNGNSTNAVFIGTQATGGVITWQQSVTVLPRSLAAMAAAVSNDKIYLFGGVDNQDYTTYYSNESYYALPNGTTGETGVWTQTTGLQNNRVSATGIAFADQFYVVAGAINSGGTVVNAVDSDLINPDGSLLNGWVQDPVLSVARVNAAATVSSDGWIYVIEGSSDNTGTNPVPTIDYGPTSAALGTPHYAPDGTYTSQSLDIGASYAIQSLKLYTYIPTGTSMTVEWQTSNDPMFVAATWSSPATVSGSPFTLDINQPFRYIRYRAHLYSDSTKSFSPVLNKTQVVYEVPPTPTPEYTNTPTETPTNTATITPKPSRTPTSTNTPKLTRTPTSTNTPKMTRTPTKTNTPKAGAVTKTPTRTNTPKMTRTPTRTNTPKAGVVTKTPTRTNTPKLTRTPTPPAGGVTYQDKAQSVTYGGWAVVKDPNAIGKQYRVSNLTTDQTTFKFSGTSVKWWRTLRDADQGPFEVWIDGVLKQANTNYFVSLVWPAFRSYSGLGSGAHTMVVKVAGGGPGASNVVVDAFAVGTSVIDSDSAKVQLSSWSLVNTTSASGGSYRWSNTAGATASFSFTGSRVDWTTLKCAACGQAQVLIDGFEMGTVDLYNATTKWKVAYPYSGLASGPHTLTIRVLGTKSPQSLGYKVSLDAFKVYP